MKITISYIDLLSASISVNRTEKPFKTSLEVIGKVLNEPLKNVLLEDISNCSK